MLSQIPLFRVVLPVMAGILYAEYINIHPDWLGIASILGVLILSILIFTEKGIFHVGLKYPGTHGFLLTFALFGASVFYTHVCKPVKPVLPEGKYILAKFRILSPPVEREKTYRVEARLLYCVDSILIPSDAKVLLYVAKNSEVRRWERTDEITARVRLNPVAGPKNPGEFDLQLFNRRKGIYYTGYLNAENILSAKKGSKFTVMKWVDRLAKYMVSIPDTYFNSPAEKALAKALVLGYKDDLDEETISRFSKSGTSHILAVSGLHVGILWILTDRLLFALNSRKLLRWLKFFIALSVLWSYALITGLSPSVMRASIMFSFFALGSLIHARYNSFNILCLACLAILILNPMLLFSAGFQLSFTAVAGILFLYPLFRNAVYFRKSWQRTIWEITSVTLSAQLGTLPVSLYWFGQFPVYFAFANLPMVPLAGITLNAGILAMLLEQVPHLGILLIHLFMLCIKLLDSMASFFSSLPHAVVSIHIGAFELLLLYGIIIALTSYSLRPAFKPLFISLLCAGMYWGWGCHDLFKKSRQEVWVIYSVKGGNVIRFQKGRKAMEWKSETLEEKSYSFSVSPSDRVLGTGKKVSVQDNNGFLSLGGKTFVMLAKHHLKSPHDTPVKCDFLIIDGFSYLPFEKVAQSFHFSEIVIGTDTPLKSRTYWKKVFNENGWNYWDLNEQGARVLHL
jgi:competence protein ComEC